jgi:hypothetical protein
MNRVDMKMWQHMNLSSEEDSFANEIVMNMADELPKGFYTNYRGNMLGNQNNH